MVARTDIKGAFGVVLEEIPELAAVENAKPHMGPGFDGMAHFTHDACLQADEIAGEDKADDLPVAVFQGLVADAHPSQRGVKLGRV